MKLVTTGSVYHREGCRQLKRAKRVAPWEWANRRMAAGSGPGFDPVMFGRLLFMGEYPAHVKQPCLTCFPELLAEGRAWRKVVKEHGP